MTNNEVKLTLREAYLAMYKFLDNEYALTQSDDIGILLGGMSFLEDGRTADEAAWEDWIHAVKETKKGSADIKLSFK